LHQGRKREGLKWQLGGFDGFTIKVTEGAEEVVKVRGRGIKNGFRSGV